ncbi:adenylate/guanylate cyclase domain-containing protein [Desertibaculum subflavum]|uniref:adenylate/guanylate cyclase domain-containing protein n=1 Tax=Desertibaculum subflavum TaxID=2268458 RepID=UPI000E670BC1
MARPESDGTRRRPPRRDGAWPAALPARVERAILAQQDHSERIIGWIHAAIVTLFGVLYALSRPAEGRAVDPMPWMVQDPALMPAADAIARLLTNPVPWVLMLYSLATAIRLVWSYRARLPPWSLVVSIVIDMTLLMALIWSFHVQYDQPPAFYLKAPTLLYVFIFIALRTLRYEERYVLIAGVVAAAGWLVLVGYAAAFDASGVPTTRNYVEYMTSARILWGAEIDKIVTILVVSALLGLAMHNGRKLLVRAIAEGEAARDLKRFFSDDVARQITGADEPIKPGEGRICDVAVLFIDLRDFTRLSRDLPPEQTVALLADYQARLVPVVRAHGGSIDKFLGDGILASFGCARPSPTYAADALAALDAVMAEAARWSDERRSAGLQSIRVGAAVAAGSVLFGAVGDDNRLEYTIIGDAVNLAAKLEKHTKVEGVRALTDAATYELARRQGYAETKPALPAARPVIGVAEPVRLVVLA